MSESLPTAEKDAGHGTTCDGLPDARVRHAAREGRGADRRSNPGGVHFLTASWPGV